jgi:predicted dehydrogenase
MAPKTLRVGLIGAGRNTRERHVPGLLAMPSVEIVAVCNRRPASTGSAAREWNIPRTYERWQDLVADSSLDAIVIGTWPYLHCPITLAALEAGKHVLTEARMALNAAEAHRMLEASRRHSDLVTQVVPSPYGLRCNDVIVDLINAGYVGELREVQIFSLTNTLADPAAPLSWRQDTALSGYNMLSLGILHETLLRWVPPPVRVMAQVHAFIPKRIDPESGVHRLVGTPDSVQVIAVLENGARAVYHFSGAVAYGEEQGIRLYGTEGALYYDFRSDRLFGTHARTKENAPPADMLDEIRIPEEKEGGWRVEAEFVEAIRTGKPIRFTDFSAGVKYMEFTEAVARSAQRGEPIELPIQEFLDSDENEGNEGRAVN